MPTPTQVTGNRFIQASSNKQAAWRPPQGGASWLYMECVNLGVMVAQFNQEAPILFPRRTMYVGDITQVLFSNQLGAGSMYASFRWGNGPPPIYPHTEDGDIYIIEETAANSVIPSVTCIAPAQVPASYWGTSLAAVVALNLLAIWVSNPTGAQNSLWVTGGAAMIAAGIEVRPGQTVRVPTSGARNIGISNPGGVNIQAAIAYELTI